MSTTPTPLEEAIKQDTARRKMSLGVPKAADGKERRFPLTPEGAEMLVVRGFDVNIEANAAQVIHFPDEAYIKCGAKIVSHAEAMRCDMVLHLPAISEEDARLLKPDAILISLLHLADQSKEAVAELLKRNIMAIALDLFEDSQKHHPVADVLCEIDGRASMAIATSLMADFVHGKGILLGGITSVIPCEVVIFGSGIAACAAAKSAIGLGAIVRMFDSNIYGLRHAQDCIGQSLVVSAMHPRVMLNSIRTADIVIAAPSTQPITIGADIVDEMKRGVIAFDLSEQAESAFPSLRQVDLATATACDCSREAQVRTCYINAGSAVPRTAAQALSTTINTIFDEVLDMGPNKIINIKRGFASAIYTINGKVVNASLGQKLGIRPLDINLLLQMS